MIITITNYYSSSAKGSPTEAIKLATESMISFLFVFLIIYYLCIGFLAIIRLCLCSNDDSLLVLIEEFTTAIEIPEKVIRVRQFHFIKVILFIFSFIIFYHNHIIM